MPHRRNARIDELFEEALQHPTNERLRWLDTVCPDEPDIRDEVVSLLEAHQRAEGILDRPAVPSTPLPAQRIGAYRIVRELGRGGMGIVYLAERDDGQFSRRVAIKILSAGPAAAELHQRFLAERQILASLIHPNIAQLLDGGVTPDGRPYLVMEYVEGLPLTEFCDRRHCSIRQRLELFIDVCAAVHHAHQNLVLHRDLKPGNILVTETGRAKLLDFGIAKLLNPGLGGAAAPITRTEVRVMTPEYASPEQVRGDPLSTSSDVYALGVILYQLMSGRRPYTLSTLAPGEIARVVCEEDPPAPSTMVKTPGHPTMEPGDVAEFRGTTPERLSAELAGDLDDIVAMALRKEPGRRYGSAALLAQDIQHHLDGLPVVAHRDSAAYRARKFLRRHQLSAAAAIIVLASLVAGGGVAIWQAVVARSERAAAQQAAAQAEFERKNSDQVAAFLFDLFQASDPSIGGGATLTARDMVERGRLRVDELDDQPLVQARMLEVLGKVYHGLGDFERERELMVRALDLRLTEQGATHLQVAATRRGLAEALRYLGRYEEALEEAEKALEIETARLGTSDPGLATTLMLMSTLEVYFGRVERADSLAARAEGIRRAAGVSDTLLALSLMQHAQTERRLARYDSAEALAREAISAYGRSVGSHHALFADALMHLGFILEEDLSRPADAEPVFRRAMEIRRAALGPGHLGTIQSRERIATSLSKQGRAEEALRMDEEALRDLRTLLGADHPQVALATGTYAKLLLLAGQVDESERVAREGLELLRQSFGYQHNVVGGHLGLLAKILTANGKYAEAERTTREAIEVRGRVTPGLEDSGVVGVLTVELGAIVVLEGRREEGDSIMRAGLAMARRHLAPAHRDLVEAEALAARYGVK